MLSGDLRATARSRSSVAPTAGHGAATGHRRNRAGRGGSARRRPLALVALLALLVASAALMVGTASASAAVILNPDSGGQNDIDPSSLNNQSDLSAYGISGTGAANTTTQYGWKWDEPFLSGNNSLDVCVYLSSTTSGSSDPNAAEYAVCFDVTTDSQGNPTTTDITYWYCPTYSTADASSGGQKCFGNSSELPAGPDSAVISATAALTTNVAPQFASDPDRDTQVVLDVTPNLNLTLVNICSKKSASPSSDSSDCGLERAPAFLKLVKTVQDGDAVPADWTLSWDGPGTNDGSVAGDNTQFVPVPDGTYNLSESGPSTYEQVSLVCSPTANTGNSVTLGQGVQETCTFTNKLKFIPDPHLAITKTATEANYDAVGDVIHYTIVATNDGNTTLTGVTVTDPKVSGLDCTPANGSDLAPGASISCTASHTVTQADIDAGNYANQACVNDGDGGAAAVCADEDVPAVQSPHLAITKTATEANYDAVGDVIHYTIVATNDGNTTLTGVTVTDPKVSGLDCTPANGSDLAPGASISCTASHTVTQADIDAGNYANQACVNDGDGGAAAVCADEDVPAVQSPHLAITKTATEANYDAVGDVIHYTIVATNDGNTTLTGVTVTDPKVSGLDCTPANGSDLAPGASISCTASHTVTQADIDAGNYANQACVNDGDGGAAAVCADEDVPAVQSPHLAITKTATEANYDAVGDVIHYTIVATNDGNTTLTGVTVTDPKVSGLDCTPANGSDLAPGASISCTASHTVTQADIDAGNYANQACVNDGDGGAAAVCADEDVPAVQSPHLAITKTATEANYDAVGDVIHYTIVATNDGNTTLTGVTVTDPKVSGLDCTPANGSDLAPGASISCTASHTVTQADIDAGNYANQACVNDGDGGAAAVCADEDVPAVQSPHLAITKTATEANYDAVGDVIHYTIVATNDGNTTLTGVTVTDPKVSGLDCTPANGSDLAPGASISCTASHTVTQADIDAGNYANQACVNDGDGGAAAVCADEDVPAVQSPHLAITKTATEANYDAVGDVIHYTIVATNDGNTTLTGVTVTDPKVSGLDCTPANGSDLAPGASISCTASHTVTQADIDAGNYANQACVNDGDGGAAAVCADEDVPAVQSPHLAITKTATEANYDAVGDVIHYTIVATNDGNTTLTGVTVTDPKVSGLDCTPANGSDLAPGASISCTASHTVTQADIDAGNYANQACVNDGDGGAAAVCADEDVPAVQSPHLAITKTATEANYDAVGDVIHYTIVATNDGNTTLTGVTVTDPKVSGLDCTPANGSDLAPGASISCTASHTVTQADIDAGNYANQACVNDGDGGAAAVCADEDVPAVQSPHLAITKTATEANYDAVGDVIHYTIVATNDGNTTLTGVTVTDPKVSGLDCTPANGSDLAPGASISCTASHTVTQADIDAGNYANQACVNDGDGGAAAVCADEDVPAVQSPRIGLTKTPNPTTYSAAGQIINYTIVAANTGNVTLHDVTVTDSKLGPLTCTPTQPSTLLPGASMSCTGSYTIQPGDVKADNTGTVVNTANTAGKGPQDQPVSNTATATVRQVPATGKITPTATTCQQFANGTNGELTDELYTVKGQKINSIAPGVFFYYSKITAPASAFTIEVKQSNTLNWRLIGTQQLILWDANCVKTFVSGSYNSITGTVTFNASGLTSGTTYYISIKYDPGSLSGQTVGNTKPTSVYTFKTYINGGVVLTSQDSVNVKAK